MPYKLLTENDAARARKFNRESIKTLKLMEKHKMAQKKSRQSKQVSASIAQANAISYFRYSIQLMDFIKMLWSYARQKIEDPTTPIGQKRAYQKQAKIIESYFGVDYLSRENPYIRRRGFTMQKNAIPHTYAFCWVPARV
jgi:transcription initiation factor TFIID subunit TAF12